MTAFTLTHRKRLARGQSNTEYALIAMVIAALLIGMLFVFGSHVAELFALDFESGTNPAAQAEPGPSGATGPVAEGQLGFAALNLQIADDGYYMTITGTPEVIDAAAPHDLLELRVSLTNPDEDFGVAENGAVSLTLSCADVAAGDRTLVLEAVPNEGDPARAVVEIPSCIGG